MTPETEALARRAVACKGWRWLPGMSIIRHAGGDDRVMDFSEARLAHKDGLPDLTDPCTLGGLLALVREAWGDHLWLPTCIDADDQAWVVDSPSRNRQTRHESYAAALVAALEAAP